MDPTPVRAGSQPKVRARPPRITAAGSRRGATVGQRPPEADRMNAATSRFSCACADGRMYIMWPPS